MLTWRCFVSCLCKRVSDMLPCSLAAVDNDVSILHEMSNVDADREHVLLCD